MPRQRPTSIDDFLGQLPADRRAELERVRAVVRDNLPDGYEEACVNSMIVYQVPLERYPDTYNRQALWYVALAAPKSYLTLHLMPVYGSPVHAEVLRAGFAAAGKRLEMGKACINYARADDLELATIGEIVASFPVDEWIAVAKAARRR